MVEARYDGVAEWYEGRFGKDKEHELDVLTELMGTGSGWCLDLGCGTGLYVDAIRSTGRDVVGLDVSADQLRLAQRRTNQLVRGDASRLPFPDNTFDAVTAIWISTDVDDFATITKESARVLRNGGVFVFLGVHPCFNGPCIENRQDGARIIHPTYRTAGWHQQSKWWAEHGIRNTVGMRHIPLAELLNDVIDADLRIVKVVEPGEDPIPAVLGLSAVLGSDDNRQQSGSDVRADNRTDLT